jgi:hypothetical protein
MSTETSVEAVANAFLQGNYKLDDDFLENTP